MLLRSRRTPGLFLKKTPRIPIAKLVTILGCLRASFAFRSGHYQDYDSRVIQIPKSAPEPSCDDGADFGIITMGGGHIYYPRVFPREQHRAPDRPISHLR